MKYQYLTNCVNSTANHINAMIDRAREITYKTFLRHVDFYEVSELLGYATHPSQGLMLKNDYHPGYYKSVYKGQPCYYVTWSAIEYIFV